MSFISSDGGSEYKDSENEEDGADDQKLQKRLFLWSMEGENNAKPDYQLSLMPVVHERFYPFAQFFLLRHQKRKSAHQAGKDKVRDSEKVLADNTSFDVKGRIEGISCIPSCRNAVRFTI